MIPSDSSSLASTVTSYLSTLRIELEPRFWIDQQILNDGVWEVHNIVYIRNFVLPGFICVDVGANAGYLTLPMAERCGPTGRVIAFEPSREVREKLLRNLALNREILGPVEVRTEGLGAGTEIRYLDCEQGAVGYGNAQLQETGTPGKVPTTVITLDSLGLPHLDFMKIDVEGMELDVLRGAQQVIERCRPIIVYETLRALPPEKHRGSEEFLTALGYKLFVIDFQSEVLQEVAYPNYPQDDVLALPSQVFEKLSRS